MIQLHLPWLELAIAIPMIGALFLGRRRDSDFAHRWASILAGLSLFCAASAWQDFGLLHASEAHDRWDLLGTVFGEDVFVIDDLSAPLLPLTALIYTLTILATPRNKQRRFSFAWNLASLGLLLATLSCQEPWAVIVLLSAGVIPPYLELRARQKPTRVYVIHMTLFVAFMSISWAMIELEADAEQHSIWALLPLLIAVFIRSGMAPLHCWMSDLFEHATFGTALLFVTPMAGAYAAIRLLLPASPDWVLQSIGVVSLITALYASGMVLVQREARRFFCYLFLSYSALVMVGLESVTPIGLTGALCVWLSVGISLTGFGLTLRAIEARTGRLSLMSFHGLYEHTPTLAAFFLLTGLASVGFPGTFGFIGTELLMDGVVQVYPYLGMALVVAAAINGIAVVHAFFKIFTGRLYAPSVNLRRKPRERLAVLTLAILILGGGIYPQPGVSSRHHAASSLFAQRAGNVKTAVEHAENEEPKPLWPID